MEFGRASFRKKCVLLDEIVKGIVPKVHYFTYLLHRVLKNRITCTRFCTNAILNRSVVYLSL